MNRRLIGGVFLIEMISLIWLFSSRGVDEHSLSIGLRATAFVSLGLFVVAFAASSINRLYKRSAIGRWSMRNRKSLGLAFALSHFVHLGLIVTRATVHHENFWAARSPQSLIPGGLVYLLITLMVITSFPRPTRWLGRTPWKILHKTGMYGIFTIFLGALVPNMSQQPYAALAVGSLLGALGLRAAARLQMMRR